MKRGIVLFGLLVVSLFLVSGQGCSDNDVPAIDKTTPTGDGTSASENVDLGSVASSKVLVDRTRYVTGGKAPFDFTTVIFANEESKGYKVEVEADGSVSAEVMTDKDCLLKGQGDEYEVIQSKEGNKIMFVSEKLASEDVNLCVGVTALDQGQIAVKFKVTELTY